MSTDIIFPFLNFFLFLFLLVWFSRKPVRALLEKKRVLVQAQLDSASLAEQAAQAISLELQEKTRNLEAELTKLREEAAFQARVFTEESLKRGVLLSQKITRETQEMMDAEFLRAQALIQTELLSLVEAATVEKIKQHQRVDQHQAVFAQDLQTVTELLVEGKL
jgi:F0F1-type ATP synthase membrane subunit b/b'